MTIAIATRRPGLDARMAEARSVGQAGTESVTATGSTATEDGGSRRRLRRRLTRIFLAVGAGLAALVLVVGGWVGYELYRIDHSVHHVGVPSSLLAQGKNDLLAIVRGPEHYEEAYVFHTAGGHSNVLSIPSALGLPIAGDHTVPLSRLNLHAPSAIIAGLDRLGIPVSHYVGVDLHMVSPSSSLGRLATGRLSVTSLISNPTGTGSLLAQVASHMYLGPGTPVSAVLSLMHVPAAHPVSVPTERTGEGHVVLGTSFASVLRGFL
jgi:hypothetical protein